VWGFPSSETLCPPALRLAPGLRGSRRAFGLFWNVLRRSRSSYKAIMPPLCDSLSASGGRGALSSETLCPPALRFGEGLQEYLVHKKPPPRRTLQWGYTQGPMVFLGGRAVSYERGTPVGVRVWGYRSSRGLGFRV